MAETEELVLVHCINSCTIMSGHLEQAMCTELASLPVLNLPEPGQGDR